MNQLIKNITLSLSIAVSGFAVESSALTDRNQPGRYYACAELYEHEDFGGQYLVMQPGDSISNFKRIFPNFNDLVSSVRVSPGCTLVAYQHIRFGGFRATYRRDTAWVGDYENDEFSSAECFCR